MTAEAIRREVGPAVWNGYFKFCVIRNPFEVTVSAFYFRRKRHPSRHNATRPDAEQFERWLSTEGIASVEPNYLIDDRFARELAFFGYRFPESAADGKIHAR